MVNFLAICMTIIFLSVVKGFPRLSAMRQSKLLSMSTGDNESPKPRKERLIKMSNASKKAQPTPLEDDGDSDELTLEDISGSSLKGFEDSEWKMEDLGSMGSMKGKGGLKPKKKQKQKVKKTLSKTVLDSEFRRIVNVANLPANGNALCKIVASAEECLALSQRLEISGLIGFTANVTVGFDESGVGIIVQGDFSAQIGSGKRATAMITTLSYTLVLLLSCSPSY